MKKQIRIELEQQRSLVESISDNISEGIYRSIPGKRFVYVNKAFLGLFGFASLEQLNTGRASRLYASKNDLDRIRKLLARQGQCRNVEVRLRRRDKSLFWASLSAKMIKDGKGSEYIDGAIRDVTAQKEAELTQLESQRFLENILNAVPIPVYVKDQKHRLILFNDQYLGYFGKSRNRILHKTIFEYLNTSKADLQTFWKRDDLVLKTGRTSTHEERYGRSKATQQEVITFRSRFTNDKGERFLVGAELDVSELKRKEQLLSALNAQLIGIMNSTRDSIFAVDKNFRYIAFNENHKKMSRLLQHANIHVGDNLIEILKKTGDDKWLRRGFTRAFKGEPHVIERVLDYSGYRQKAHLFSFNPIRKNRNEVVGAAVFIRDVSPYKAIQHALLESNAHLQAVLESTRDQVFSVDRDKCYIAFNSSHRNAMESLGQHIKEGESVLLYFKEKTLQRKAIAIFNKALRGTAATDLFEMRSATGALLYFEGTGYPIVNKAGKITGVAAFFRNVTRYKEIERALMKLNDELARQNTELAKSKEVLTLTLKELSDRNFELDQLMYKTSHDLRSPLSSILGLVNLAKLDPEPGNKSLYIGKVEDRIQKLDEFIRSMLNYAKVNRGEIDASPLLFDKMINNTLQSLEYLDAYNKVKTKIKITGKTSFHSDPVFAGIIISNIISNAYKYYDKEKASYLTIDIKLTKDKAHLNFVDNGIGIHERYLPKIFNMFFRGTDRMEGSGLGMYIVKQAVEKLGGTIELKSQFGNGTEVNVSLPNLNKS